ncbi:uncharacterized protein LOC143254154 isoform X4 [Tachypleus tridentatus]|uniref:uncharacterized protein LOC143254154 isoform X4 n=1 Tax=Tachypleus tridentatus TaxID=6853 RepID=UPI003FD0BBE5
MGNYFCPRLGSLFVMTRNLIEVKTYLKTFGLDIETFIKIKKRTTFPPDEVIFMFIKNHSLWMFLGFPESSLHFTLQWSASLFPWRPALSST